MKALTTPLINGIRIRRLKYFDHISRSDGKNVEIVMQGRVEGNKGGEGTGILKTYVHFYGKKLDFRRYLMCWEFVVNAR